MTHSSAHRQSSDQETSLSSRVARIAGVIASDHFPTGERAALRRMNPGQPPPLAFYGFAVRHLPENWENRLADWITLVAGMAVTAPNSHDPRRSFGRALAQAGFSEARMERLLAADEDTRRTLLLRTARFLAAKNTPFDWSDVAQFILITNPDKRSKLHLRIAKDFYIAMDQLQKAT